MKIKGKRIINTEEASEFANSVRGQYILSQALVFGIEKLKKYEDKDSPMHSIMRAEPSNRKDMEYLLDAFPLYRLHEREIWYPDEVKKTEEWYAVFIIIYGLVISICRDINNSGDIQNKEETV